MAKRKLLYASVASVLSLTLAGQFVCSPVFAEGPVDISIVEKVDDGTGNYKDWEDITNAMPGASYSAMPRIQNNGSISVMARMCLAESGIDVAGNTIELDAGTFQIDINEGYWTRESGEDDGGSVSLPIEVCYKYNSELGAGEVTEPLFYEVGLGSELGNEYQNATFSLHLYAEAMGDLPDEPVTPSEPNTGKYTSSEPLTVGGYVALSVGAGVLIGMIIYLVARSLRRK